MQKFEPLTSRMILGLRNSLSPTAVLLIDFNRIDLEVGRRVNSENNWSMWTKKGYRVDVILAQDGGLIVTQSREIDPDKPRPLPLGGIHNGPL